MDQFLETIKTLSSADVPKVFTIRYFMFGDSVVKGVHGYSIDMGSYTTKTEAEIALLKLVEKTKHNKFYIVESGKWSALSNNEENMKINFGKLDDDGVKLFKNKENEMKQKEIENKEKEKEIGSKEKVLNKELDVEQLKNIKNLINLVKLNDLETKLEEKKSELLFTKSIQKYDKEFISSSIFSLGYNKDMVDKCLNLLNAEKFFYNFEKN